jgi:protein-disulfide isomerase
MTKPNRREARDRLAEERRQRQLAEARRRRIWNAVIVVIAVVAIVAVGVLIAKKNNSGPPTAALPQGVSSQGGGVVVGSASAPVKVDLWEDFQCPHCKDFEHYNSQQLASMVASGQVQVTYHPLSFLDQSLQNDSSSRAANAFGCAADYGKAQEFHAIVFANQPTQEGVGYTDAQLIEFGKQVGITDSAWSSCVTGMKHAGWVQQVESSGTTAGVTSTPTIIINGKAMSPKDTGLAQTGPDAFKQAVDAAAASSSSTPTPSSSSS